MTAIPAEVAKKVWLELLLIPRQQMAHSSTEPATSAAAAVEMTEAADDAIRIHQALWQTDDASPTFEDLQRELSKAQSPELTAQLLFSAHSVDDAVNTSTGNSLPSIPATPRYIACSSRPKLTLSIKSVDEDPGLAMVVVIGAENPDDVAMKGLFERRATLAFDETAFPGLGKLLVLAQAADANVPMRVSVRRGLGPASTKHDQLGVVELVDEVRTREIIAAQLVSMKAVTEELPFNEA